MKGKKSKQTNRTET